MHGIQAMHARKPGKRERPLGCHAGGLTKHGEVKAMPMPLHGKRESEQPMHMGYTEKKWVSLELWQVGIVGGAHAGSSSTSW